MQLTVSQIDNLLFNPLIDHSWDYNGLCEQRGTYYGNQNDWNQTLLTRINQCSSNIHRNLVYGGADTILVPIWAEFLFDSLDYFKPCKNGELNYPLHKIGILGGGYNVYVDISAMVNALILFNSNSPDSSAIIYLGNKK